MIQEAYVFLQNFLSDENWESKLLYLLNGFFVLGVFWHLNSQAEQSQKTITQHSKENVEIMRALLDAVVRTGNSLALAKQQIEETDERLQDLKKLGFINAQFEERRSAYMRSIEGEDRRQENQSNIN